MTLQTAVAQGAELLAASGTPEPRLTAELLLCHAVHCERAYLYAHPEQDLREVEWIHYGRWLHERMQGKPLQYITRTQEFYGRPFRVTPRVLIPRPETEILVETVLRRRPGARLIVDVGAGSGAIAVTLALETQARVVATDISLQALEVAAANAAKLSGRVDFIAADLLNVIADSSVDVVVSNPPYVAVGERESMQREVRDWEPHIALFAGDAGLDVYRRLIPEAQRVLRHGGLLALELGFGQADAVKELAAGWQALEITPDLAGIPRVLSCESAGLGFGPAVGLRPDACDRKIPG
ncbi:MAG TPA: peptide chain release factor N(5)-glutamine methyltransferase [Bryobacteraceae bacterium]|nr:peptide chain release factor N(5)-glutamine methyltransferase [Bryobacteraceae bacterium]